MQLEMARRSLGKKPKQWRQLPRQLLRQSFRSIRAEAFAFY
jgi:hypothetical protein